MLGGGHIVFTCFVQERSPVIRHYEAQGSDVER